MVLMAALALSGSAYAQQRNQQQSIPQDYVIGTQLLRQGQFDRAAEIFQSLVEKYPGQYMHLEGYIMALSNLKEYDKAITAVEGYLRNSPQDVMTAARLGELYHTAGDTANAYSAWDKALAIDAANPNVARVVAESMQQRREFDRAAALLQQARTQSGDASMFLFELANIYLIAGRYEQAAKEYNAILLQYPERLQFVQRQYSRYNDQTLVDAAIVESDESIRSLPAGDERIGVLREFQIWLLLERGLYRRAIATARGIDAVEGRQSMALFNVAQRLATQNEFELSTQALEVYSQNLEHPLSARSSEELASVDMRWARWLITSNLDTGERVDSLFRAADSTLKHLLETSPNYQRRAQVVVMQTELALDYLKDGATARDYLARLDGFAEAGELRIEHSYLEGRILLFEGNFNEARVVLTRANTQARIGDMAEKTRYFLALTDFFSKDYEFANIQLKALERQNASLYANDALQLRIWIMEGRNRDSTTTEVDLFSKAQFAWHTAQRDSAAAIAARFVQEHPKHALADDALLLLSQVLRYDDPVDALLIAENYIRTNGPAAMTERLLWERIQLASRLKRDPVRLEQELNEPRYEVVHADSLTNEERFFRGLEPGGKYLKLIQDPTVLPELVSDEGLAKLLEDLLVQYPQGFYSSTVRSMLRNRNPS